MLGTARLSNPTQTLFSYMASSWKRLCKQNQLNIDLWLFDCFQMAEYWFINKLLCKLF